MLCHCKRKRPGSALESFLAAAIVVCASVGASAQAIPDQVDNRHPAEGLVWHEITGGFPPHDDITTLSFGKNVDDLWVGTTQGRVWKTEDGGVTYDLRFWPIDSEPSVEPRLRVLRTPSVGDLSRGANRNIGPRDRQGRASQAADLAGSERGHRRDRSAALLGSVVRSSARDRTSIHRIALCPNAMFLATAAGLWRSRDEGWQYTRLNVGPIGSEPSIHWLSCDSSTPGRLVINTEVGVLVSVDYGESFYPWANPHPRSTLRDSAGFDGQGRLITKSHNKIYRELIDANGQGQGYEILCEHTGDSVAGDNLRWAWTVAKTNEYYGVTGDGILICSASGMRRFSSLAIASRMARFVWLDDNGPKDASGRPTHLFVATDTEVLESTDGGASFATAFIPPTLRSIKRIMAHPGVPGDLLVVTGGQIYRRRAPTAASRTFSPERVLAEVGRQAPLGAVIYRALEIQELDPAQVDARRVDLRLRALLPTVSVRFSHGSSHRVQEISDRLYPFSGGPYFFDGLGQQRQAWSAFAVWDVGELLLSKHQTDGTWADIERLRQRLTWHVQDAYALWLRERLAAANGSLTVQQRATHVLWARESAAYLDRITGNTFPLFSPTPGATMRTGTM